MIDNATAIYCFFDDYLKKMNHKEDKQRTMNDAEIILVAYMAVRYFCGNFEKALICVKSTGLCKRVLSKSRFNRRLHAIQELIHQIFTSVGEVLKEFNTTMEYLMDSFPIRVCHNIRIARNSILPSEKQYRGKCVSKREYFYGFKVQVITTIQGVPVEFAIVPGSWSDSRAMHVLSMHLPSGSRNINDCGYTNYEFEDLMQECENIWYDTLRKTNSKRKDTVYREYYKKHRRKLIETVFSKITAWMPKKIHATTIEGFLLKIKLFIWNYTFNAAL
jgi:hypothetical protein